jgi:general secretion pathway protein M
MTVNNDRTGALLALSLLVLGLAAMLGLATAPYLGIAALTDETAESRQLLAALEAQLARQAARGGGADPAALMLQGETPGIAGAALQRQINDHVSAAGGQASSLQLLPPRASGSTTRLALGFAMRIDIGGLRDVLHAIETGEPLLFVDDIAIRTPENAAGEGAGDARGPLDVTMQVSSFLLTNGGDSHGQ